MRALIVGITVWSAACTPVKLKTASLKIAETAGEPTTADTEAGFSSLATAGNPFVEGWYADPDMKIYDGVYWVYPTYSAPYEEQTFIDAFSSTDMVHWTKHDKVLDKPGVRWAQKAIWAPSPIARNGKYYLYFGANDIQKDSELGGIGVATADNPAGPYVDPLGKPLIPNFVNGAQPIDQNVFIDDDGKAYIYYGGWGHCNVARLNDDMVSLGTLPDGKVFKEITPSGYVEGALMFKRRGIYYLMWSEGGWTGPDYRVSYAMANSPLGPFNKLATILSQNLAIGTGSGHNTVVNTPGTEDWYIFYHRHPLGETEGNHRVLAYDAMYFNEDGTIKPIVMTTKDDFSDGNAIGWKNYGGKWRVDADQYVADASGEAKSLLNTNFSALDYEADVSVGATGDAGLLFRISNPGDGLDAYRGYYVGIDAAGDRLYAGKSNGGWTELGVSAQSIDSDKLYHIRVVAKGAYIAIYFNRSIIPTLAFRDESFKSGTIGLRAHVSTGRFDNISAGKPNAAAFYEDGNFSGTEVVLGPGSYTLARMQDAGIPDNWMSSLAVPAGWRVEVYQDDAFRGAVWTFTSDTGAVPSEANDQMSSVRVFAP